VLTLPKEITKNGQGHVLPLTPHVLELLPLRDGLLFPARGQPDRAFNGWSKSMDALRKSSQVPDFRLHDLRRTAATMMASLGVPPHIVERMLNHITGTTAQSITPLGRIYNRHRYLDEMRAALMLWEAEVLRLLGGAKRDGIALTNASLDPGQDLALEPTDAARAELDAFWESAGLLEAVNMSG
jgi:integrase